MQTLINETSMEDLILLREVIADEADNLGELFIKSPKRRHQSILDRLRVARQAIGVLNGPISDWYKENRK